MNPQITFSISGTAKAATTYIFDLLSQHPDICVSRDKETDYFQHNHRLGLSWFEDQFSHFSGETAIGEASPGNLVSPDAPDRMHRLNPNIQVIFVLRDPVDRLISQYYFEIHRGTDRYEGDFSEWIRDTEDPWRNRSIELGLYYKNISRFREKLGEENCLLLDFEDMRSNIAGQLTTIFQALGVDDTFAPDLSVAHNQSTFPTKERLYKRLRGSFRSVRSALGPQSPLVKLLEPIRIKTRAHMLTSAKSARSDVSDDDLEYLSGVYQKDLCKLEEDFGFPSRKWMKH